MAQGAWFMAPGKGGARPSLAVRGHSKNHFESIISKLIIINAHIAFRRLLPPLNFVKPPLANAKLC